MTSITSARSSRRPASIVSASECEYTCAIHRTSTDDAAIVASGQGSASLEPAAIAPMTTIVP
jgi:hypothetical protein